MTAYRLAWLLFIPGFAMAAWAYLPDLHLGHLWTRIAQDSRLFWSSSSQRALAMRSHLAFRARRLWARLRGKPVPQRIVNAGGILSANVTQQATIVVTNPEGEAAIRGLQEGLALVSQRQSTHERKSAEEREQDRLEADRVRRRSALYGLFGLALIGVATVLWALPR